MKVVYFYYNGTNGFYGRDEMKRVDSVAYVPLSDLSEIVDAARECLSDNSIVCMRLWNAIEVAEGALKSLKS